MNHAMNTLELLLLFVAYSVLLIAIFLQLICYKRKLENRETVAFTLSLLLLIVALTAPYWLSAEADSPNVFTLLAMTAVGLTTILNVIEEREVALHLMAEKAIYFVAGLLALASVAGHFLGLLPQMEYPVAGFLVAAVIGSMLLIRTSRPREWLKHRERSERLFAMLFMIVVPASMAAHYVFEKEMESLQIGFTVPLVFILLGLSKCFDDLQRLRLFGEQPVSVNRVMNLEILTERENEIALLLSQGKTYKDISDMLFISVPTVKTHTSNIYRKLEVKNKTELTLLIMS